MTATPLIRPMLPADVAPAADMIRRGDWGDRTTFLAWAVGHPSCHPFVADARGRVIGTGIATANGPVGWVGTIFVDRDERGAGTGKALTKAVIDDLEARGCRTLTLIATSEGRPVYERLGFTVQTRYVRMAAPSTPLPPPATDRVRPLVPEDLPAVVALDRAATGEDRGPILRAMANADTCRVALGADGSVVGFLVRAPWGGTATIAAEPEDAVRLLDWRRARSGPDHPVVIGVLTENTAGRARLAADGWTELEGGPRMVRGAALDWRPGWIYGQFNGALG